MCCVYKNLDGKVLLGLSTFSALADEDVNDFATHWNEIETANTAKSFVRILFYAYRNVQAMNLNFSCRTTFAIS